MTPWQKFKANFQNKKVLIMGLGLQGGGVAIANLFSEIGAKVTVTDLKDSKTLKSSLQKLNSTHIRCVLGEHRKADFKNQDLIIRNPAVPQNSPFLKLATKNNIPIKMETALFAKLSPAPIIGVTGTRGKSTTSRLIYEILKKANQKVFLAGNIPGKPTLPLLKKITPEDLVVLELSSWQLQGFAFEKISPHIAVVTNIYPDHLNRHPSMNAYIADKKNITNFQKKSDYLILNQQNLKSKSFSKNTQAQITFFKSSNLPKNLTLKIPGLHNRANASAALAVANILNINKNTSLKVIKDFRGLPYRLEQVTTINNISIINDTTSTTPTATIAAIKSISQRITLILGGKSKNLPVKKLAQLINKSNIKVVLLKGSGTTEIKPHLNPQKIIAEFSDQDQAIKSALKNSKPKTTLLFSPGFTSFEMFNNEFQRGDSFNQTIKNLSKLN